MSQVSEELFLKDAGEISETELVQMLQDWMREAESSDGESLWRSAAIEDYQFYAGNQDDPSVISKLRAELRPTTVFNEIKTKIDTLIGLSTQLKLGMHIYPVGVEDEQLAEVMGVALKHYQRELEGEKIETDCFAHTLKSGRSLQGFFIDTSNPFEPQIKTTRVEGTNFFLDPLSKDFPGMLDARYLFVTKWLHLDELRGFISDDNLFQMVRQQFNQGVDQDQLAYFDATSRKVRLTECWYRVWERVIWFVHPLTKQPVNMTVPDFEEFNAEIKKGFQHPDGQGGVIEIKIPEGLEGIEKRLKKVKYAIFAGDSLIESGDTPFKGFLKDRFPYTLYGAYKDDDTNRWFSAIQSMKDPQRGLNTIMRQLIHLLQTSPKGILLYETGAIPNISEYEESSSKANFALATARDAISGNKIKFTDQPIIPNIYERLLDIYEQMMKSVSGVRDALLGVPVGSREPGITMQLRQQSGMAALVELFERYKSSRVHASKQLIALIQQYVPYNTIVRIFPQSQLLILNGIDPSGRPFNDISTPKFDIFVDEGVEGETMRLANAKILTDFAQNNPGTIPPDVLIEQTNLSFSAKQRIHEFAAEQREAQFNSAEEESLREWAQIAIKNKLEPTAENIEGLRKLATQTREKVTKGAKNGGRN